MIAGVVLDDWKLPTFRRELTDAGFEYKDAGAFTHDTTLLQVQYESQQFALLKKTIEGAHKICGKKK